jgi:hypothetical protein
VKRLAEVSLLPLALLLGGCVVVPPSGPSMMVLPGSRMTFEQFQIDDAACRQFATAQIGGQGAGEAAQQSAAASTVAGTAIGAAAGAALGGNSQGAAVGAGIGLLTGAMMGMGASEMSYREVQRRYDAAYYQCMYARGHRVPVYGSFTESARPAAQPRAPAAPPPPPPQTPAPAPAPILTPPPDAGIPPPDAPPPPSALSAPAAPYVPPYWPAAPPPNAPPPR